MSEPPAPARRRWPLITGVSAIATLLAAALGLVVARYNDDGSPPADDANDEVEQTAVEWDERILELVDFVEAERGLEFEHPVQVDFLTHDQFSETLRASQQDGTDTDGDDLEDLLPMLRALGLVSGNVDLFDTYYDLADSLVAAFYDPDDERIEIPAPDPSGGLAVELRVTLVHELVHALQDQHFDLDRDFDGENLDEGEDPLARRAGFTALVEGDAMRVEFAYLNSLPSAEMEEFLGTEADQLVELDVELADVPKALVAFELTPYLLGRPLVDIVALEGGDQAIDEAFDDPPTTGTHVLNPLAYLEREPAADLDAPAAPSNVDDISDRGQLGAVDVYLVLAERIDPFRALDAADGWGNALYVSYRDGGQTCLRIAAIGSTEQSTDGLRGAFDEWAAMAPGAADVAVSHGGSGELTIESCDPGPDAELVHDRSMATVQIPAIRSGIAAEAMLYGGMSATDAWQLGDCFVRQFTVEELTDGSELAEDAAVDAFIACGV